jgi:Cu2+-exporting ATPase
MFAELLGYTVATGAAWVSPVLGTVLFFYGGWPFLTGALTEIRARRPGMMLLIALAITVAFVASGLTSLGVGGLDLDFWWEVALLIVIMLLGHWLEMRALGQASSALDALAALLPDTAERLGPDGGIQPVALDQLVEGDTVLVRSGGRVPADGIVVEGRAELDESMVTGESRAVARTVGDRVVAGTVATDSAVRVRVDAVGEATALAGIRRLVEQAQASRSRAQALADRAAAALFYFAVAVGAVTFLVWMLLGQPDQAIERTVTVLVIACPHALGLAIPLVIAISTAMSARAGILVKDRLALERMRTLDAVLFDKTGTLTKGRPAVVDHIAADPGVTDPGVTDPGATDLGAAAEDRLLALAGAAESDSEHPLARAVVEAARRRGPVPAASGFRSLTGRGVLAEVDGMPVAVGGPGMLRDHSAEVPDRVRQAAEGWSAQGSTVLYVLVDGHVAGALALADEIRPESAQAVRDLQARGVRVVMITGDARPVADAVGAQLGVDEVSPRCCPPTRTPPSRNCRRAACGWRWSATGSTTLPPWPAPTSASPSVPAPTSRSSPAGVVLASDDPRGVLGVITLSRASYRKMLQNLAWATGYNLISVPLAAGVLAPIGFVLAPAVGAILMSASTIVVAGQRPAPPTPPPASRRRGMTSSAASSHIVISLPPSPRPPRWPASPGCWVASTSRPTTSPASPRAARSPTTTGRSSTPTPTAPPAADRSRTGPAGRPSGHPRVDRPHALRSHLG